MTTSKSDLDKSKLFWHSRRGMLELDLLLLPFLDKCFDDLSEADQALYQRLLENEDQDLFAWLMRRCEGMPADFADLIEQILANAKA